MATMDLQSSAPHSTNTFTLTWVQIIHTWLSKSLVCTYLILSNLWLLWSDVPVFNYFFLCNLRYCCCGVCLLPDLLPVTAYDFLSRFGFVCQFYNNFQIALHLSLTPSHDRWLKMKGQCIWHLKVSMYRRLAENFIKWDRMRKGVGVKKKGEWKRGIRNQGGNTDWRQEMRSKLLPGWWGRWGIADMM